MSKRTVYYALFFTQGRFASTPNPPYWMSTRNLDAIFLHTEASAM